STPATPRTSQQRAVTASPLQGRAGQPITSTSWGRCPSAPSAGGRSTRSSTARPTDGGAPVKPMAGGGPFERGQGNARVRSGGQIDCPLAQWLSGYCEHILDRVPFGGQQLVVRL